MRPAKYSPHLAFPPIRSGSGVAGIGPDIDWVPASEPLT
jgi:hypothetical protein